MAAPRDDEATTIAWNAERAKHIRLLEVRGTLPETVTCPESGVTFQTGSEGGAAPKRSTFTCSACGTQPGVMTATKASKKGAQIAGYGIQGFAPKRAKSGAQYAGRFFSPF